MHALSPSGASAPPTPGRSRSPSALRTASAVLDRTTVPHRTPGAHDERDCAIVVGADDAGVQYKKILRADLERDDRVALVIDVGVTERVDPTIPTSPSTRHG